MTDKISSEQTTLLRQMMCHLACYPDRYSPADLAEALRQLATGLNLEAAGIYWQSGEHMRPLAHWPATFTPPSPGEITGVAAAPGRLTTFPMRCDGATLGALWLVAARPLTPGEKDFMTLAANQLALVWQKNQLYRQLSIFNARRGELLRRLIQADEQCSRRVSRELHDEISQSLTALIFEVDTVLTTSLKDAAVVEHRLSYLRQKLVQVTDEVNRIVLDLRPTLLENNGLMAALGWYGTERLRPCGTQFNISGGKCVPKLSTPITTMLYRIGQEALSNIARHSSAQNAWLDVSCQNNTLALTIRDDGCGFNAAKILARPQGLEGIGLMGMLERAALVEGTLTIESQAGQGTFIQVKVPLANNNGMTNEQNKNSSGR